MINDPSIFLFLMLAVMALVFLGFFSLYMEYRRKPERRGFEVRTPAGGEPANTKEKTHG